MVAHRVGYRVAPPFVQQGRREETRYQKWVLTLRYRVRPDSL